jgi:hypothetical protein
MDATNTLENMDYDPVGPETSDNDLMGDSNTAEEEDESDSSEESEDDEELDDGEYATGRFPAVIDSVKCSMMLFPVFSPHSRSPRRLLFHLKYPTRMALVI